MRTTNGRFVLNREYPSHAKENPPRKLEADEFWFRCTPWRRVLVGLPTHMRHSRNECASFCP
ncbi:hypothetical protein Poly41_09470 [Novipirellula artificiosorum]|uniref:Uncharacterized protein n=1 Tax=Novipirellula artificiosorum TaxID=2528016 RepID=A0A5C6E158_9BACT|nr:hypothetical protein Poly41_09470 [Novipirellula artificiosorum]